LHIPDRASWYARLRIAGLASATCTILLRSFNGRRKLAPISRRTMTEQDLEKYGSSSTYYCPASSEAPFSSSPGHALDSGDKVFNRPHCGGAARNRPTAFYLVGAVPSLREPPSPFPLPQRTSMRRGRACLTFYEGVPAEAHKQLQ
jgi:hypothetical protein